MSKALLSKNAKPEPQSWQLIVKSRFRIAVVPLLHIDFSSSDLNNKSKMHKIAPWNTLIEYLYGIIWFLSDSQDTNSFDPFMKATPDGVSVYASNSS